VDDEGAQDAVGGILTDSSEIDFTYDDGTPSITAALKNASIAYARLQNISATQRVLGRNTAGAGVTEEVTLTQLLDWIGSATRGDVLIRGASAWARLGIGTNGYVLRSDGTDPAWAVQSGVPTTIDSGSLGTGATKDLTGIPATYNYLGLYLNGISCDTATRAPVIQVSTDNGSSWDSTAGNYLGHYVNAVPTLSNNNTASMVGSFTVAAAVAQNLFMKLFGYQGGMYPNALGGVTGGTSAIGHVHYIGSTSAINGLRIGWNASGNIDAGTYTLLGFK
jgi:hypothetical protein